MRLLCDCISCRPCLIYYVISSYVCKDLGVSKGSVLFCSDNFLNWVEFPLGQPAVSSLVTPNKNPYE